MSGDAAIDGVILDVDGVLTDTASVHERAWKEVFDALLAARGQPPFTHEDYLEHVDGKPRYDGARSFLRSRGIELPDGEPDDPKERETVRRVGDDKNARLLELLEREGVRVFDDAPEALRAWDRRGLRLAMVSSSRNAAKVIEVAGLGNLFHAVVDGRLGQELGLAGKPAPDYFLEAARRLGVAPTRAAVFEDARSGVEAARRGGFGRVVGVARDANAKDALWAAGADTVVSRLTDVDLGRDAA